MTFISFIAMRPPDDAGLAASEAWTTVSTDAWEMTLAINGLRMSARTNSARPIRRSRSRGGGTVSTPRTRSIVGSAARRAARWPPRKRLTPVTRTTLGAMRLPAKAATRAMLLVVTARNRGQVRRIDAGHAGFTQPSPDRRDL